MSVSTRYIGKTKAQGGDVDALMAEVNSFADRMKAAQAELEVVKEEMLSITDIMPNLPHDSVPEGKTEDDNIEVLRWGTIPDQGFEVKDHVDLVLW